MATGILERLKGSKKEPQISRCSPFNIFLLINWFSADWKENSSPPEEVIFDFVVEGGGGSKGYPGPLMVETKEKVRVLEDFQNISLWLCVCEWWKQEGGRGGGAGADVAVYVRELN